MTMSDVLMPDVSRFYPSFVRGQGVHLYDEHGKRYLDFGAGIAVNSLGHCHSALVDVLQEQSEILWHSPLLFHHPLRHEFANLFVEHSFAERVFFCNSGTEAIECLIKLVRRHFFVKGQKQRHKIITLEHSFHGRTMGGLSASGQDKYHEGVHPIVPGFVYVPVGDIEAMRQAIDEQTAAILVEPIQGEGGIHRLSASYLQAIRQLCDEHGLLLGLDEIQSGIGRTGKLFCYEHSDIQPDLIAVAKGIGSGFPLGVCLATAEAACGLSAGSHGTTYGGNPLAMRVGMKVLEIIRQPDFLQHVQDISGELWKMLFMLKDTFPTIIRDVRGMGLMIGLQIDERFHVRDVIATLLENGLVTIPAGSDVVRILPPLIIGSEDISQAQQILYAVFNDFDRKNKEETNDY